MQLVVLGDSIALGETCYGCATFPVQLAEAMQEALGVDVEVQNLAVGGAEVADTLKIVRDDSSARDVIADADAVVITVGHNDLAYNRLDDPCKVAPNYPRIDWSAITNECVDAATDEYRRDLDAVLTEIERLRDGQPTMLRVTAVYNIAPGNKVDPTWDSPAAIEPSTYAVEQMADAQCKVVTQHDGACADTYHALHGKDGSESAQPFLSDATHLGQRGEDAFADALIDLGFAPLE